MSILAAVLATAVLMVVLKPFVERQQAFFLRLVLGSFLFPQLFGIRRGLWLVQAWKNCLRWLRLNSHGGDRNEYRGTQSTR